MKAADAPIHTTIPVLEWLTKVKITFCCLKGSLFNASLKEYKINSVDRLNPKWQMQWCSVFQQIKVFGNYGCAVRGSNLQNH